MDFIEGLPKSQGKLVIIMVVDRMTKFAHFIGLAHLCTAREVATTFLDHVYKLHGLPHATVVDRDTIFTSNFWLEFLNCKGYPFTCP